MHLDRTHADFVSRRQHAQLIPDPDFGAHRRAGDDDAVPLDHKRAIERKTEDAGGTARLKAVELADDLGAQFIEAEAGYRRDLDYRRAGERRAVGEQLDLVAHLVKAG